MPHYLNPDHTPADLWRRAWRRARPFIEDAITRMPEGVDRDRAVRAVTERGPLFIESRDVGSLNGTMTFAVDEDSPAIVRVPLEAVGIGQLFGRLVYEPDPLLDDDLEPS